MTTKPYVSKRPGTRMSRADRVAILLTERKVFGRPLVFTARHGVPGATVHVVGPDEDQPAYTDVADYYLNRRVRTVCGFDIRRTALQGAYVGTFDDDLLCSRCHRLFGDDGWMIFDDNTDARQDAAHGAIASMRAQKDMAAA